MGQTARKLRILGLQVEDAYRKGGAAMVVSRSARRAAAVFARMIRRR
jgi:DNA helicase TIP49 (TBP-interacting protein)